MLKDFHCHHACRVLIVGCAFYLVSFVNAAELEKRFSDAVTAFKVGDFGTAKREFQALAFQGQAQAQRFLGRMYDKGLGVPQDYDKAIEWYRKAATQKDSAAQYYLGLKYANGHGVAENQKQAYIWFAISFNNGYEPAADPIRVLNKSLSTNERQEALKIVFQKMELYGN